MADRHASQPPLAGRYPWVVAAAVLGLAPYLVLSTASPLLTMVASRSAHLSMLQAQIGDGISNAGYSFGAVLASFLVQRYRQRVLYLLVESLFVVGSALVAASVDPAMYLAGKLGQGAATGLMLVVALPPLIIRFPASKLPSTAIAVNIGLFGAITIGPFLGGETASGPQWRLLFAVAAGVGVLALVIGWLALAKFEPFNPEVKADYAVFGLALAGTSLPFLGVSWLVEIGFAAPLVWSLVAAGLACLVVLMGYQRARSSALIPIGPVLRTVPFSGLLTALVAGAVVVGGMELLITLLADVHMTAAPSVGALFWPEIAGVAISATAFGVLVPTRWVPVLVLAGLLCLVAATAVLWFVPTGAGLPTHPCVLLATGLLGLGAGSTVSPGLFTAAWSVESRLVGRVFALVELLRAEAAFLVGPVLVHLVQSSSKPLVGFHRAMGIELLVAAAGAALVVVWYLVGGAGLTRPMLSRWLAMEGTAIESPRSGARVLERGYN